jgi:hypothetical protein
MRINHNNPNLNALSNAQALEQAARRAAQAKAEEMAQARTADEIMKLQDQAEELRKKKTGGVGDQTKKDPKGYRTTGYSKNGSVKTESPTGGDEDSPSGSTKGIDLKV